MPHYKLRPCDPCSDSRGNNSLSCDKPGAKLSVPIHNIARGDHHLAANMPPIRTAGKRKRPPEGFTDIEDDLLIFSNKMKDAQNKPPPPGPKHQAQWEIFQISHQRSRYVYDLYYEKEAISKQLYDWLLKNGYADAMLIAKWKKQGYEKVGSSLLICKRLGVVS